MKTEQWVLAQEYTHSFNQRDSFTLPSGAFVLPMETKYVPKHVREAIFLDSSKEIFCYTHFGIIPIPKKILRLAE